MSTVGEWISPQGTDLTAVLNDPFDVLFGAPGQLLVETPLTNPPIGSVHEGVYACVIPDEAGLSQRLHIGIYFSAGKFIGTCYID